MTQTELGKWPPIPVEVDMSRMREHCVVKL